MEPNVENTVLMHSLAEPVHGQKCAGNGLRRIGVFVSPSGIRSIWLRHGPACFKDQLKPLKAYIAETGEVLTESQLQALKRKKAEQEAHGKIEAKHPGYLGSQDTFYVGTLKGVGRIYQQTYVGTY